MRSTRTPGTKQWQKRYNRCVKKFANGYVKGEARSEKREDCLERFDDFQKCVLVSRHSSVGTISSCYHIGTVWLPFSIAESTLAKSARRHCMSSIVGGMVVKFKTCGRGFLCRCAAAGAIFILRAFAVKAGAAAPLDTLLLKCIRRNQRVTHGTGRCMEMMRRSGWPLLPRL